MSALNGVSVCLAVATHTDRGEVVCVVGDLSELGAWSPHAMIPLVPKAKNDEGLPVWSHTVVLPVDRDVHYRFIKAYLEEDEGQSNVLITSWESHLRPRYLSTTGEVENPAEATFGVCNGEEKIERGWLTGQTEVRMRLHSNPIKLWKPRYRHLIYSIACTPVDLSHGEDETPDSDSEILHDTHTEWNPDEESNHELPLINSGPPISVSVLRDSGMEPHTQPPHGTMYKENDYMVFTANTFHMDSQGYKFDIFTQHSAANPADFPKHLGTAYLLPMSMDSLMGSKTLPINRHHHHKPIGHLTVEYLLVRPLPTELCNLSATYARHWKLTEPINVGHRGLGATYSYGPRGSSEKRCEALTENTIASFSEAQGHGAKFVEFDVHLTKDRVPVIYHDMNVGVGLSKKDSQTGVSSMTVAIKDLTLDQLQTLKVNHLAAKGAHCEESPLEDERPFPTLRKCFECLPLDLGFNVEVKYAMPLKAGGYEEGIEYFTERNDYLDVILTELLTHAGKRKIILSAFDPDVCAMLRVKQNRYPVLFLCSDECAAWPAYRDVRTRETTLSAAFCASEHLLGINVYMKDLLARPELVETFKGLGLIVFCWTSDEETNSRHNIQRVKKLRVHGVIFDKIYDMDERLEAALPTEEANNLNGQH